MTAVLERLVAPRPLCCLRVVKKGLKPETIPRSALLATQKQRRDHGRFDDDELEEIKRTEQGGKEGGSRFSFAKLIGYAVGVAAGSYVAFKVTNLFAAVDNRDERFEEAYNILLRGKESTGAPCLVCAVWIDGKPIWKQAIGLSDVENCVKCTTNSVMRIASISKAFTSIGIGKLLQSNQLDLDKPIQEYVPSFPSKEFNGKAVKISLRQILSHTSGIRGYKGSDKNLSTKDVCQLYKKEKPEFYIKENFSDSSDALNLFSSDQLTALPGRKYFYSTLAYTVAAAAIENISRTSFVAFMEQLFDDFGMQHTVADDNDRITDHRTRYYWRDRNGLLQNSPYVDLSCKFAGGGFLSSVNDLNKFGSKLLQCYQDKKDYTGFLRQSTLKELWSVDPVCSDISKKEKGIGYALGWSVKTCSDTKKLIQIYHTGGAVGCSSILMIIPTNDQQVDEDSDCNGVVISIMANIQGVSLKSLALKLADVFTSES